MDLCDRMRARADADGLHAGHVLRVRADRLQRAVDGWMAYPPTATIDEFLGAWARARKSWSEYSGEPLI